MTVRYCSVNRLGYIRACLSDAKLFFEKKNQLITGESMHDESHIASCMSLGLFLDVTHITSRMDARGPRRPAHHLVGGLALGMARVPAQYTG